MLKKLLFFLLVIISSRNSFSQKEFPISIKGEVLNSKNNEKLFGALIYLMKKDVLISRTVSEADGFFLLTAKVVKGGVFDLIIFKNGFIVKKILVDLTNINLSDHKQNTIAIEKQMNIALFTQDSFGGVKIPDSVYSEKYSWNQQDFQLIEDESYRLQFEDILKLSNSTKTKMVIDSSEIELQDKKISKEFLLISELAKLLAKEKKFKSSIEKFSEAELLLAKISNIKSKNLFLSELNIDKKKMLDKKNSEDQVFNKQLSIATKYYDLGPKGYAKAKKILTTEPMESRVNEPEVIALIDRINKMEAYFDMKYEAYLLVNLKNKNPEAIISLQKTEEIALLHQKIVPINDFAQLSKSIDSLQLVINPKSVLRSPSSIVASTADQGRIIVAPGDMYTGSISAYKDILEDIENKKNALNYKKEDLKNHFEQEMYIRNTLNDFRNQDAQIIIVEQKNNIEELSLNRIKILENQQLKVQDAIRDSEVGINQQNLRIRSKNESIDSIISKKKDELDLVYKKEIDEAFLREENQINNIQNQQEIISLKNNKMMELQEAKTTSKQMVINSIDYTVFQKDSLFEDQSKLLANKIQDQKDYKKSFETTPNYLKNESGVLYERNKMTEVVFIIKNLEGFVSTVVLRRVVVDKNGYGIVYEQTTNEKGKNSFTRNGLSITEKIWFDESTGINVIEK